MLRDVLNDSFNRIVVNDPGMHGTIKEYLGGVAKDKLKILNLHKGRRPLFDQYGISRQIKASFGKSPTMRSGAYLVIEHTEAMHVIDVNSGPKMKKTDQETAAISVNLEAAEEIARQLRLRDLGGLIIIANFGILQHTVRRAFSSDGLMRRRKMSIIAKYYLRLLALGVIIYFLIDCGWVDPVGLAVGLSTVVISIIALGIYLARKTYSGGAI